MTAAIPDDDGIPLGGTPELQRAWQMMAGGSTRLVTILYDIAENSPQDSTRVAAATAMLKMVGFGQDSTPVVIVPQQYNAAAGHGDGKESAAKRLEARMALLRAAQEDDVEADEDGIIDAVIVEEEPS